MIVMTCDELRVKCESDIFKDDSSVSRLLRMSAMKLHALFRRIPEMEEYDEMMVEVNDEVTEVGEMLDLYEQWKVAGTHSKAVSFNKVANALGKIEKAVRQNDGAHFSKALEKSSPLFERLDDSVQALVAALTEVHEKLDPEYFQTGGAQSTEMAGSRVEVDEAGAGILSENTGAQRFIGSKMKATARTAFASDNHLTGDQAVVVATSSHLVSGGQIFSGNTGKRGRDNYLGARLICKEGNIGSGNRNEQITQVSMTITSGEAPLSSTAEARVKTLFSPSTQHDVDLQATGQAFANIGAHVDALTQHALLPGRPVATKQGVSSHFHKHMTTARSTGVAYAEDTSTRQQVVAQASA